MWYNYYRNKIKEVENMEKYSNNQIEYILKSNNFKKSKNGSFYKVLEIKKDKIFKIRVSNHKKHHKYKNEIIFSLSEKSSIFGFLKK